MMKKVSGFKKTVSLIQRLLGISVNKSHYDNISPSTDSFVDENKSHPEQGQLKEPSTQNSSQTHKIKSNNPFADVDISRIFNWQKYFGRLSRPAPVPEHAPQIEPGGRFVSGSYTNAAGARDYKLYIPSGYQAQNIPLIVMLHGCTQNPDDFAVGTQMNILAEEQQCFVVYPAQTTRANQAKCWNWFNKIDQQRDHGEPSLIAGITREVMDTYTVDSRRVYVAGLSAGGAMAAVMAITYPELYAAVGIHSGLPYAAADNVPAAFIAMRSGVSEYSSAARIHETIRLTQRVPAIVFHGDQDTKVNPRNGDQLVAQWIAIHAETISLSTAIEKPRANIHEAEDNGYRYSRTVYRDASEQTILEQWRIHEAGHTWSGGSSEGSYTDTSGPNASREMIRFFYEHGRIN